MKRQSGIEAIPFSVAIYGDIEGRVNAPAKRSHLCNLRHLWFLLVFALTGCTIFHGPVTGELAAHSLTHPNLKLAGQFDTGIYRDDGDGRVTVILLAGPIEHPTQALTLRMLWQPHAGLTPIDPTATNATLEYLIFAGGTEGKARQGDKETRRQGEGEKETRLAGAAQPPVEVSPFSREAQRSASEADIGHSTSGGQVGVYSGAGFVFPRDELGGDALRMSLWQSNLRLTDRSKRFRDLLGQAELKGEFTVRRDDAAVAEWLRQLAQEVSDRLGYPRLVRAAGDKETRSGGDGKRHVTHAGSEPRGTSGEGPGVLRSSPGTRIFASLRSGVKISQRLTRNS